MHLEQTKLWITDELRKKKKSAIAFKTQMVMI